MKKGTIAELFAAGKIDTAKEYYVVPKQREQDMKNYYFYTFRFVSINETEVVIRLITNVYRDDFDSFGEIDQGLYTIEIDADLQFKKFRRWLRNYYCENLHFPERQLVCRPGRPSWTKKSVAK